MKKTLWMSLICLLMAPAQGNAGSILYSIQGGTQLVSIDPATGAAIPIGSPWSAEEGFLNGIAFDHSSDRLLSVFGFAGEQQLVALDRSTGNRSAVGPIGFNIGHLAFDSTSDTLYGVAFATTGYQLISIDPVTGAGSLVGEFGNHFVFVDGLAYDASSDALFSHVLSVEHGNHFVLIDQETGESDFVATNASGAIISGLAFDGSTGTLFGITSTNTLVTLDTATGGLESSVGLTGMEGLSFLTFAPTIIPEPSAFLLGLIACLGALVAGHRPGYPRRQRMSV